MKNRSTPAGTGGKLESGDTANSGLIVFKFSDNAAAAVAPPEAGVWQTNT
jgi:hypothetical protein